MCYCIWGFDENVPLGRLVLVGDYGRWSVCAGRNRIGNLKPYPNLLVAGASMYVHVFSASTKGKLAFPVSTTLCGKGRVYVHRTPLWVSLAIKFKSTGLPFCTLFPSLYVPKFMYRFQAGVVLWFLVALG